MPYGPSGSPAPDVCGGSITAEAAWWFDRQHLGEVEFGDRSQRLRRGAVLLIVRQAFQPGGVPGLQVGEFGARIVPSPEQASAIGRTAMRITARPAARAAR
jgi:hypothetical protein